jgi:hypothetical protein
MGLIHVEILEQLAGDAAMKRSAPTAVSDSNRVLDCANGLTVRPCARLLWAARIRFDMETHMNTPLSPTPADKQMVTGLFPDRDSAEAAYVSAAGRGYSQDDMNLVMSDETRQRHFLQGQQTALGSKAADGAGIGGVIGGTVGAIAGAIAAIGTTLVLPGVGWVIAGPMAAALAGAGAGAAGGGLLGALVGWGIPEERVKYYEEGIRDGNILMGVVTNNSEDAAHIENSWRANRGTRVHR